MQYKNTQKIVIDKRKLDILLRLNCPKENIYEAIVNNKIIYTDDELINDNLESFVDVKVFENWGGSRRGAGRKPSNNKEINQVENQDVNHLANQEPNQVVDIDKDIDIDIDKYIDININNTINNKKTNIFKPPKIEEVTEYCNERKNNINPLSFISYYESVGWMIGKKKMKNWKAAIRTWELKDKKNNNSSISDIARKVLNEQK